MKQIVLMKYLVKKVINKGITCLYYLFRIFPIKEDKIVIDNYAGAGFGDNGKYIVLELLKRGSYDIVWLTKNEKEELPKGVRRAPYSSIRSISIKSIYEQVTAKIWIDNLRKDFCVRKRKGQYYIMTWHGGIGPKKIEKEVESQLPMGYVEKAKNDSNMTDLMIAESDFTYWKYSHMLWYDGEILKCGTPRQDILFNTPKNLREKIFKTLNLDKRCHVFLYAPTFREGMSQKDLSLYKIAWKDILQAATDRFGGEWVGFIRLHPNIAKLDSNHILAEQDVYDVTDYPDMQELLSVSDIVLTDYSSCIYDFGLTGRPGFMLAEDIEEYTKERDIGFGKHGMEIVPFSIAKSSEELITLIREFDNDIYEKKLHDFYYDFCGLYSGGHAAEILANRIDDVIRKGKNKN